MICDALDKLAAAAIPILYCGILAGGAGFTLQLVAQRFTEPTVTALLLSPVAMIVLKTNPVAIILTACMVLFVAVRHKENFKRLMAGTEKHFLRKPKEE